MFHVCNLDMYFSHHSGVTSREIQLQSNKDLSLINKNFISNNQSNANMTCIPRVNVTNIHIAER